MWCGFWIISKKDLAKSLVACDLAIRLLMFQDLTLRKEQAIYNVLICPVFQSTSIHTNPRRQRTISSSEMQMWPLITSTFYLSNYLHYSKTDHHNSLGGGGVTELLNLLL